MQEERGNRKPNEQVGPLEGLKPQIPTRPAPRCSGRLMLPRGVCSARFADGSSYSSDDIRPCRSDDVCDDAADEAGQLVLNADGDIVRVFMCNITYIDGTVHKPRAHKTLMVSL